MARLISLGGLVFEVVWNGMSAGSEVVSWGYMPLAALLLTAAVHVSSWLVPAE